MDAEVEDSIGFKSNLISTLHPVPSPLKHLYLKVLRTGRFSLMLMMRVCRSRSDRSPL